MYKFGNLVYSSFTLIFEANIQSFYFQELYVTVWCACFPINHNTGCRFTQLIEPSYKVFLYSVL